MKKQVLFETETGEISELKPRFKTQWNAHAFPTQGEINLQPSMALPDQALTVQEIIKRHSRGLPIFGSEMSFVDDKDPLNGRDINSLDIEEVWQIAKTARENYQAAQQKYMAEETLKQKERYRKSIIEEHEKLQKIANPVPTKPEE